MTYQYDDEQLKFMTPEQINDAYDRGELDDLLGRSRYPANGDLNGSHLRNMSGREVREGFMEGRLDNWIAGE